MNVSGIVSLSESSRPRRDQLVDVVVDERAADRVDRELRVGRAGGVEDRPDRREERRDPGRRRRRSGPTIRTVVPSGGDEAGLGRRLERVEELVEGRRRRRRRAARSAPRSCADEVADRRLERRVRRRARAAVDDDQELLVRVVRAAGVEDVVGLAGLELALVRVLVRVGGVDPAHRQAVRRTGRSSPRTTAAPPASDGGRSTSRRGRSPARARLPGSAGPRSFGAV